MNIFFSDYQTPFNVPPFERITEDDYLPAVKEAIALARKEIDGIKAQTEAPTFANTIEMLEATGKILGTATSVFFNLTAADTNDRLQALAKEITPLLTQFGNDILLDEGLFERISVVYEQKDSLSLTAEQQTLLEKTYQDFVKSGANLNPTDKKTLRQLNEHLANLSLTFGDNVLKETNSYQRWVSDPAELDGLPEGAMEALSMAATEAGQEDKWLITLEPHIYSSVTTYANNRALRQEVFRAYQSKAFKDNENDNRPIIKEIVKLRHQKARLLGFDSLAEMILQQRMAESPEKVMAFLDELLEHAVPVARKDKQEVLEFARQKDGLSELQRWDFAYYAEKLKKEKFQIDDELLKPYFKLENAVDGVFAVANRLYGLTFVKRTDVPVYHPEVSAYEVKGADGAHIGLLFADFFPRGGKRAGAWMTSYRGQWKEAKGEVRPLVSIVCNFTKPTKTKPSLLTFNEVRTLFHEFGHALHGLLANGQYQSLTGTNVYWDFVELPSQLMENWLMEKECLDLFAVHYQTGEKLPAEMVERIKESSAFLEGYQTVRQISLAKLDMAYHTIADPDALTDISAFEDAINEPTRLFPKVEGVSLSCQFGHIFQGGYAAGYYSYKWAEVLDADAFEAFKASGIFNREVADKFREHVLSAGGSEHPMILYKRFRGQEPSPKALLKRSGLLAV